MIEKTQSEEGNIIAEQAFFDIQETKKQRPYFDPPFNVENVFSSH